MAHRTTKAVHSSGKNNGRGPNGRFTKGNSFGFPPGVSGNPKGRPTTHDELRGLIQELLSNSDPRDERWTRLAYMIAAMASSKNAADHVALLEHGWGKVPQQIDVKEVEQQSDSDLIEEFQHLVDTARARASADDSSGVQAPDSTASDTV